MNDAKSLRELIRNFERKLGALQGCDYSFGGITMAQCHTLVEIGRSQHISLNDLAQIVDLDNSTMSRTVQNLVKRGYVKREADEKDRRYVTITLTQAGENLFNEIETDRDAYFKHVFECIPTEKQQQVLESIHVLIEAIELSKDHK